MGDSGDVIFDDRGEVGNLESVDLSSSKARISAGVASYGYIVAGCRGFCSAPDIMSEGLRIKGLFLCAFGGDIAVGVLKPDIIPN